MRHPYASIPRAVLAWALPALAFAAAAAAQVAVFDGELETTAGGFRFGDGTLQTTAATGGADYAGIVVVDQRGGGDFTTIQPAIDAIGTTLPAASGANPYLVRVAPGVYSEQVTMKEWVDLEGAGEGATTVTWVGADDAAAAHTLETADNAELRFLTVENTGGAAIARGVIATAGDSSRRLYQVTVDVSGGSSESAGVVTTGGSSALLRKVTALARGPGAKARGFQIENSSPTLLYADASASGTGADAAIRIGDGAAPTIRGGSARVNGAVGTQNAVVVADASATIVGLAMYASGGSVARAILSTGTPARPTRVQGSRLEVEGGGGGLTGAFNNSSEPLTIHGSAIVVPAGGDALDAATGSEIHVASSLVDGALDPGGTYLCVASFDGSFAALGANCL